MNETPLYDAAAWAAGFAPIDRPLGTVRVLKHEAPCGACTDVGASGWLCPPCAGEIAAKLRDPDDELVSVFYSGHGINHTTYRPDVTR